MDLSPHVTLDMYVSLNQVDARLKPSTIQKICIFNTCVRYACDLFPASQKMRFICRPNLFRTQKARVATLQALLNNIEPLEERSTCLYWLVNEHRIYG